MAKTKAKKPNFEYTITIDGIKINSLDINLSVVDPIELTGEIYADLGTPFYINLKAERNNPTGFGTFQLKDIKKKKNVFEEAQDLTFENTGRGGLFLPDVQLP